MVSPLLQRSTARPLRNAAVWLLTLCLPLATVHAADAELPLEGETETLAFSVDEASWVSVSTLPEGDGFVFDLLGDLYRLPLSGGPAERITSGMGYDSQPVVSPDGSKIAFVSDRNGKDNLWVTNIDGSEPLMLSDERYARFISPTWTPDSSAIVVTVRAREIEMHLYAIDGGSGVAIGQSGGDDDNPPGVGPAFSPDGNYLYFAERLGAPDAPADFPVTQIVRVDMNSGERLQITRGEGGGVRPVISPDGSLLVYGTRYQAQTGLRVRNLETGADNWLYYPVQRDAQENYRPPSRGLLPGYSFTADGESLVLSSDGQFRQIAIDDGSATVIPFTADIELDIGPDLTRDWRVPTGPLTATLAEDPDLSPDGDTFVASVLTRLYTMERGEEPEAITPEDMWAFKPTYSPDGRWIAFVSWTPKDGGHVWKIRSNGNGRPQQLSESPAFYTDLVWQPDGERVWALKGNEWMRQQDYSEFGGLSIPLELVSLDEDGGDEQIVLAAGEGRVPHFGPQDNRIYLSEDGTLVSYTLDGLDRREHIKVTAPRGSSFRPNAPGAEEVRISPNGDYVLAHAIKQVWLVALPRLGSTVPEVAVRGGGTPTARLTDIGADFISWNDDGSGVRWAIGSTVFERPLDSIAFREDEEEEEEDADENEDDSTEEDEAETDEADSSDDDEPFVPLDEHESVVATSIEVVVPRAEPEGDLLLTGANLITMAGSDYSSIARNQDLLISNNRIAAIGARGSLTVPEGAETIDVSGRYIIPGLIDTHAHWEFRTGDVLEPTTWSVAVNLAYGVTSGLDVQTAQHDYFAYRDMQATGQTIGQRAFMTGPGIFGSNDFRNYDAVHSYLRRYSDHYRTPNIKSYVVGNREQRHWVVQASQALGLLPTTEGGGDQRMDLTHAIDGMHGNEHNLPDTPIFADVVELYARTATAYTPTLIVQYNAPSGREYYFTRTDILSVDKLQRFYPRNRLLELANRRPGWARDEEFNLAEGAEAAAQIQRAGGLVGVGGHAELQGLGYHWELWTYAMGGMTPAEILQAATVDAATIIGAPDDLGSIEVGKLADLVILGENPLDDIRNTTSIEHVVQNGVVFDGDTLNQVWPEQVEFPTPWWLDADAEPVVSER